MSCNLALNVLVVDDEPTIASTLVAILQMHGYSATFFTSPLVALSAARMKSPDLLISDVGMPDVSGINLAVLISAVCPGRKVLLFSGAPFQPRSFAFLPDLRVTTYLLLKTVPPPKFLAAISKMVGSAEDVA